MKQFLKTAIAASVLAVSAGSMSVRADDVNFSLGIAFDNVAFQVSNAPPLLPVYDQPPIPGPGYVWAPGYWAYDDDDGDYFWVPGTWIMPPRVGLYWTPGFWFMEANVYRFRPGYWGPTIGYYGGVNYGFGYSGHGYDGGRWEGGRFMYNAAVSNVNVTNIDTRNVYRKEVTINRTVVNNVSYVGGQGGLRDQPTDVERRAEQENKAQRVLATDDQNRHVDTSRRKPEMHRKVNEGKPMIAATRKAAALDDPKEVVRPRDVAQKPSADTDRAGAADRTGRTKDTAQTERDKPATTDTSTAQAERDKAAKTKAGRDSAKKADERAQQQMREKPTTAQTERESKQDRSVAERNQTQAERNRQQQQRQASPPQQQQAPAQATKQDKERQDREAAKKKKPAAEDEEKSKEPGY